MEINVSSLKYNPFTVCRGPGVPNCVPFARVSYYDSDLLRSSHFRPRNSELSTRPRHFGVNAIIDYEIHKSIIVESEKNDRKKEAPVYVSTPLNRDLRTPHTGYHFDRTTRKFLEGWYFKATIPEKRQSFCFMYTVENPAFSSNFSALDEVIHGHLFTGVGAQILGADDKYICQYSKPSKNFWGSWIEWGGELFEFTNAPSNCEKNWGGGFPRKWFWVQCNAFNGAIGEISLTSGGGFRKLPGLGDKYEELALIAVHYNGIFYEFVPWTSSVNWEIAPWGY